MKKVKRFYFSCVFYLIVFFFSFYTLKYFISDAAEVSFLLATMYFVVLFVRKSEFSFIPHFLHSAAGLFLGFAWVGFTTTVLVNLVSLFLPISQKVRFLGLAFAAILALAAVLNNRMIMSRYFTIRNSKIKQPVRIAQISDLHVTGPKAKMQFEKVMTQVLLENPDVIVISGDLIDVPRVPTAESFDILHQIRTPIIFVTGNHDYYAGADYVQSFLEERGVHVLRGAQKTIKGITFVGVDDPTGKVKLESTINKMKLPATKYKVLVYHQPRKVNYVVSKGFDLMLSGHTHAGQMYPFNYVVRLQFKYVVGFHRIKNMILYINPGTGTWEIPMRIGSKNTIAVFDLKPKNEKKE